MSHRDLNLVSYDTPARDDGQTYGHADLGLYESVDVISDTLKITSGVKNVAVVVHGTLAGGSEDCVDMNNRAAGCIVHADRWAPRGKFLATIKGGTTDWHLSGAVVSHGMETDIDLGNWSDQCQEITGRGVLELVSTTGRPIRVRVLHAEMPEFAPGTGPYRYVFPWPWLGPVRPLLVAAWRLVRRFIG